MILTAWKTAEKLLFVLMLFFLLMTLKINWRGLFYSRVYDVAVAGVCYQRNEREGNVKWDPRINVKRIVVVFNAFAKMTASWQWHLMLLCNCNILPVTNRALITLFIIFLRVQHKKKSHKNEHVWTANFIRIYERANGRKFKIRIRFCLNLIKNWF